MARKLLWVIPVLALLLLVIAQQLWSGTTMPATNPEHPSAAAGLDPPRPAAPSRPTTPAQRLDVTPGIAAVEPEPPIATPPPEPPWTAGFLVVDAEDHPIADAIVSIRDHTKTRLLRELHTDDRGRADCLIEVSTCFAAASKPGLLSTGHASLWRRGAEVAETRFVLEVPMLLRGVVLRADGSAAAGARVIAAVCDFTAPRGDRPPDPDAVTAGSDGRFEVPVRRAAGCRLHAELDRASTFEDRVWVGDGEPQSVVLRFAGGITLTGVVVDTNGNAAAGATVKSWREVDLEAPRFGPYDGEHAEAETDASGRFSIPVRQFARYQLIASQPGSANSRVQWVETTSARPHGDARLELLAFGSIHGRVLHSDGSAFAGVRVRAQAETGRELGMSWFADRDAMFQQVRGVATAADGSFTLAVHPCTSWTVLAQPGPQSGVTVQRTGVLPGSADVVLTVSAAELAGCVVHGTVRRQDGQPIGKYRVALVRSEGGATRVSGTSAEIDGEHFTLPPLPLGMQCSVRVTLDDRDRPADGATAAPAEFGPFTTDRSRIDCDLVLPLWGSVRVFVRDAQDHPVARVRVNCVPVVPLGYDRVGMTTAGEGRADLHCAPGPHRLQVVRAGDRVCDQELIVGPGPNPEVTVRLPAAK